VKLTPDGVITLQKLTASGLTGHLEATGSAQLRGTKLESARASLVIPRGSAMFPSAWLAHRDRQWWGEEPTRFDPEHFTAERTKSRPRYAYFPFGAGQRMCIGNNLSILETVVAVVTVLRRFRIDLPDGFAPRPRASFALDLEGGLPARAVSV